MVDEKAVAAVQKLEWRKVQDGLGGFIGRKQYRFVKFGWGGPEYAGDIYPTTEKAKAVAQRDFALLVLEMAALANLSPGSTGETEGWVLVPKEPTPAMMQAALEESRLREHGLALLPFAYEFNASKAIYRAMLSAAGER